MDTEAPRAGLGEIRVLGAGHLAAAVRTQLRLLGLYAERDCPADSAPALLVACMDYECPASLADFAARATGERAVVLLAWTTHRDVRLLVLPASERCTFRRDLTHRYDFGRSDRARGFYFEPCPLTLNPDTHARTLARFGALVVTRELCALLLRGPTPRTPAPVAKFDAL
ncbi:MAG: hypothetical protein IRZ28_14440 [Steroidobacteraceae bacterium]|nr:hypothetical protein [Steroidobacteraceae bacterium]